MATSPFSGSVLVLRENQDGIHVEVFHWDNVPDGTSIPPRGPIAALLMPLAEPAVGFHAQRMAATRTDLIAKFTAYVNAKFPDTTA